MTLAQLVVEFKHLFGGHGEGHGEEGHTPVAPGTKPEGGESPGSPAPAVV